MKANGKKIFVKEMFDDIHGKYDFLNTVLSFGQDRSWRKKAVREISGSGLTIDLCSGGGQLAYELFSRKDFRGDIIIADISPEMLKHSGRILDPKFSGRYFGVVCDVENLPFKNNSIDNAISAFSLRNLTDLKDFSCEVGRVLLDDGLAQFLEIGHPENSFIHAFFNFYFYKLSPLIARLFTSKAYAYRYLPNSLKAFPLQKDVIMILGQGWAKSDYSNILFGIAAIYKLQK